MLNSVESVCNSQYFVLAVFGKVQTFWVLREPTETQPDKQTRKDRFFLNKRIPV